MTVSSKTKQELFDEIAALKKRIRELEKSELKSKKVEEALRQSEAILGSVFNAAPLGLCIVKNRVFQNVNKRYFEKLGYSKPDLIGQSPRFLYENDEEYARVGKELFTNLLERGRASVQTTHLKKNGDKCDVMLTAVPLKYGDIPLGMDVVVFEDITDRKQAEQALRDSESRWEFALEGAGDGVWDWDAITNRVHYSRQWKNMLGYSEQEIGDGLDEWDLRVHPDDKAGVYVRIERHLQGETESYQSEHRLLCKDGSYKWILDRGKVIEWTEDGKPRRVIGTHTDITRRKQIEEELTTHRNRLEDLVKERTQELERKTEDLQEMNAALKVLLKQRDDDKKEMAERYVSNIRNLIFPYIEKLAKTHLNERQLSYLEMIQEHFNEIMSPLMNSFQLFNLTPMEMQVASLIKNGKSTKDIAKLMTISTATVDNHRKSIRKKLGLNKIKANLQTKLSSLIE